MCLVFAMIWMILKVNYGLAKWDLCIVIYMFLSNNPSSWDINSLNISCWIMKLSSINSHPCPSFHNNSRWFHPVVMGNFSRHNLGMYEPRCEKTCLQGFRTTKGADQPTHLHSLIISYVILSFETIIFLLATCKMSIIQLVAENAWIRMTLS